LIFFEADWKGGVDPLVNEKENIKCTTKQEVISKRIVKSAT